MTRRFARPALSIALAATTLLALGACQTAGPPTSQVQHGDRPTIDDQVASAEQIAEQFAGDLATEILPQLDDRYTYDLYIAPFRNLDPRTSTTEFDLTMRRIRRGLMKNPTFRNTFNIKENPARMEQIAAAQQTSSSTNPFADNASLFQGSGTDPNYILVLAGTFTPIRRADGAFYDVEVNVSRVSDGQIFYIGDFSVQYGRGAQ